jgi:hypothetical protein
MRDWLLKRLMMALDSTDRNAAFAGVAALLGAVGFMFLFSDPREGWIVRVIASMVFFFFASVAIGYAHPGGWLIAMLISWGGVAMGGFITLMAFARYGAQAFDAVEPPFIISGLVMLFAPIALTLLGGFVGKQFSMSRF